MAIGLITDQSPNMHEAHYWTTFLNQDTVFMDGAERIAKMMDFPVFYCEPAEGAERILPGRLRSGNRPSEGDSRRGDYRNICPQAGTDHSERTGLLAMVA